MAETRFWRRSRVIIAVLLAALLVWVYRVLAAWNDRPTVFLFGFVAVFALLVLADWVFDLVGPPVWRLVRSLASSMSRAVEHDPEVEGLLARHPGFGGWLRDRLTTRRWTGFPLTATVLLALWFLAGFASVARDVVFTRALALYDPQVAALLRAFRTPPVTHVLWIATVFGDPRGMFAVATIFVLLLLLWGRRAEALLVGVTMAAGSAFGDLVKIAAQRPRPPAFYALIREPASFSFPSGHALASLLFFALLAFVLWRTAGTSPRRRFAIVVLCAFGAFTVALSRIYLGVHWPTDVLGSWYLGAAWLTVTIGAFLMWERYGRGPRQWAPLWTGRARIVVTAGVVVAGLAVLILGAEADPLLKTLVAPPAPVSFSSAELPKAEAALPRYTEKLDGSAEEPVSIVFVGSEAQLQEAFRRAEWQQADQQSLTALLRVSVAALGNQPYPTAPVTPAFVGGKANDLAFERPQGVATVRRRHHVRFWSTNVRLDGRVVWVATASFDMRLEIGSALPLPTHHIDPNVDKERAYVVAALTGTGLVREVGTYQVTRPESGTNAEGDKFYTDGRAVVLEAR